MKNIPLLILTLILISSCDSKQTSSELEKLTEKIKDKENQISELQTQIENLEKSKISSENNQTSDYYRFVQTSESEINVSEKLKSGERKLIDKKDFKDTLDISDNFFVYKHTSEITQTSESEFESVLRDFDQVKSEYGKDFFVRVMTFYNGQSLPLETENSKTDIHILIQPTELGYENKTFVISDFYDIDIKTLEKKENSVELTFEHGKFPRKKEQIIIRPELVKFKKNQIANIDNNFKDFLVQFNKDSIFQISRVKLPMTVEFADWEKDYEYSKEVINHQNYRKLNLVEDPSSNPEYEQFIKINGLKAIIEYRGIENGISAEYYFEKIDGKWTLITWVNSST
ncbi:DUF4348 domain-containing protein [Tenacibaculum sp. 47A_GOM-205m]|uniref:DUF4348 domain-containing protein n=1 Tax=Tenacibaculum sp. 47A_GOM-205m TaxID=1380384 RepID=UPI0004BBC6CE|nr:DUF4348 domain-containing protein [Tenacibaculum sp. 47A_GOM-205m]